MFPFIAFSFCCPFTWFSWVISRFSVLEISIASGDLKCVSRNCSLAAAPPPPPLTARSSGDLTTTGEVATAGGGGSTMFSASAASNRFKSLDIFPSPPSKFRFGTSFSFLIVIFLGVVVKLRLPWLIISFSPLVLQSRVSVPFLEIGGVMVGVIGRGISLSLRCCSLSCSTRMAVLRGMCSGGGAPGPSGFICDGNTGPLLSTSSSLVWNSERTLFF